MEILLALLFGAGFLAGYLPYAVLAGIMLTVAVSLSDRWTRQVIHQWRSGERRSCETKASASSKAPANPSRSRAVAVRGTPAAAAIAARSLPVDVAVGKPPTDSRLSLSKITWTWFLGR